MAQGVWSVQVYAEPPFSQPLFVSGPRREPFLSQVNTGWLTGPLLGHAQDGLQQSQYLNDM